ncbi:MAG: hypothetical protein JXA20_18530 [Spirochaetes bacterium]|nr:hypothetical protein [Spirochaetota bacterium]
MANQKRTTSAVVTGASILLIAAIVYHVYAIRSAVRSFREYTGEIFEIEHRAIRSLPIYDDFITDEKEGRLRQYLQSAHMKAAQEQGIGPVTSEEEIQGHVSTGDLVSADIGENTLHFFYNVKKEHRYLTPTALRGLRRITERFQANLRKRVDMPPVKIAVSSAIRPTSYQKNLRHRNVNAMGESSHGYGTSFDIFYDEFYVSPPPLSTSSCLAQSCIEALRPKIGYMTGASLRRQLRAILTETILELQDEGLLYAILERRQRCYHITVLKGD